MIRRHRITTPGLALVVVGLIWSLIVTTAPAALAAPSAIPDTTWMVNGKVYDMTLSEDGSTLYLGGRFTRLLPPPGDPSSRVVVSNLAAFDVSTGAPVQAWTVPVTGDTSFVHALLVRDGTLFVGGRFTAVGGEPRRNLASIDLSTGDVLSFAPEVGSASSNAVFDLIASDDRLYVGGAFGVVDGASRAKLAAFELPGGTLSPGWKPRVKGGSVRALAFDSAGDTVFATGFFDSVPQSGTVYTRESLARFDATTGALHGWSVAPGVIGDPQTGWDIVVTPTVIYGGFGRGPNFAAAFALDQGNSGALLWKRGFVGNVQTLALSADGSRLFTGGHFGLGRLQQTACGVYIRGLVSLVPSTGVIICDWIPQLGPYGNNYNGPWTMLEHDQKLWVGGGWTTVAGEKYRNIARFTL